VLDFEIPRGDKGEPGNTGPAGPVAGSAGQVIYNNADAAAGLSTFTVDVNLNLTFTGRWIQSTAGSAGAPAHSITGAWFTGGTSTTTKPQFVIEPAETTSNSWSTAGTGLGVNASSGFMGNLLDIQLNSFSRLSVSRTGHVVMNPDSDIACFSVRSNGIDIIQMRRQSSEGMLDVCSGAGVSRCRLDGRFNQASYVSYRLGVNTAAPTCTLDIAGDSMRLQNARTPANATATGLTGEISWDANYIYVCTATNTWKRVAISTW
jgi:hypothetical protein